MIEIGAKVRIKDDVITSYTTEFQRRMRDRIGVVTGRLTYRKNQVRVDFPAQGRKHFFSAGMIYESDLEVVEDDKEPA